jgi:hypothetical protein
MTLRMRRIHQLAITVSIISFLIGTISVSPAQNLPPNPPKHPITVDQKTAHAQPNSEAKSKQTPAPNTIILNDQSDCAKQNETAQQHAEGVDIQRNTLHVTWILAIAGILQFIILLCTFWIMRGTARKQLRAYITVSKCQFKFIIENDPEAMILVKNSGQTPAYKLHQWIAISPGSYPLSEKLTEPWNFNEPSSEAIIGPGDTQTSTAHFKKPLSKDILPKLGTREWTAYIYGLITYEDIFGKKHKTIYRYIYGGPEVPKKARTRDGVLIGLLSPDSSGNEAD